MKDRGSISGLATGVWSVAASHSLYAPVGLPPVPLVPALSSARVPPKPSAPAMPPPRSGLRRRARRLRLEIFSKMEIFKRSFRSNQWRPVHRCGIYSAITVPAFICDYN
jgi:hypothetical protein